MLNKKQKEPVWIKIIRILLAALFLYSGFTKAVDPVAASIQFDDYFISFELGFLHPISLFCAFSMNILEFLLGFMLLFRIRVNYTAIIYALFMAFFLLLTFWLFIAEYLEIHYGYNLHVVKDCGCFGKAIKMTNLQTFIKNVIIIIPVVILLLNRKKIPDIRLTIAGQWILIGTGILICFFFQLYCFKNLPVVDFSDWKKGSNIKETFIGEPAQKQILFVYQNNEDSTNKITLNQDQLMSITDQNPLFYDKYSYKDRIDSIVKPADNPKKAALTLLDSLGKDHSYNLINYDYEKPVFLLIMSNLEETDIDGLKNSNLKKLINYCKLNNIDFIGVTNSPEQMIIVFSKINEIEFPVYFNNIDPVKGPFIVRDAIRSNPGLIQIKRGIVVNKWSWRNIPLVEEIEF